MIRYIEDVRLLKKAAFLKDDPLFCRLAGNAAAYGLGSSFFDVWLQEDDAGTTAAVGRLDAAGTLVAKDGFDARELLLFLQAAGFESLLCREEIAFRLPFPRTGTAALMKLDEPAAFQNPGLSFDGSPSPRTLYAVLETSTRTGIKLPPFDGWYVDVSHKLRRGLIRAVVAYAGKVPVGCAMTAGETGEQALLSAVAVAPGYRGRGYGRALVGTLCQELHTRCKRVYLLREETENGGFYRSLGFVPYGKCAFLRPFGEGEING